MFGFHENSVEPWIRSATRTVALVTIASAGVVLALPSSHTAQGRNRSAHAARAATVTAVSAAVKSSSPRAAAAEAAPAAPHPNALAALVPTPQTRAAARNAPASASTTQPTEAGQRSLLLSWSVPLNVTVGQNLPTLQVSLRSQAGVVHAALIENGQTVAQQAVGPLCVQLNGGDCLASLAPTTLQIAVPQVALANHIDLSVSLVYFANHALSLPATACVSGMADVGCIGGVPLPISQPALSVAGTVTADGISRSFQTGLALTSI